MTTSSGKVILLGEHAVVLGCPAIAMSLDRGVRVETVPDTAHVLEIPAWNVRTKPTDETDLGRAYGALLASCHANEPRRLRAELEIPAGAGLGCSAALGSAVAKALLGPESDPQRLFTATQEWEKVFHGNPSGIDAWAAQGIGLFGFARGTAPTPIRAGATFHFVVCYSGSAGNTKEMVVHVAKMRRDDSATDRAIENISACVMRGARALEAGQSEELGRVMHENHEALQMLGVSTPELDRLCEVLTEFGALGAKLTGSGGGGCVIGLFPSREQADVAVETLASDHNPCFALSTAIGHRSERV